MRGTSRKGQFGLRKYSRSCFCAALIVAGLSLVANQSSAEVSWVCAQEQVTGFSYDTASKKWVQTRFTANTKYLVSSVASDNPYYDKSRSELIVQYGVTEFGRNFIGYSCKNGFFGTSLNCEGIGDFIFDSASLRFVATYKFGYVTVGSNGEEDFGNTPLVEIGTCVKLQ